MKTAFESLCGKNRRVFGAAYGLLCACLIVLGISKIISGYPDDISVSKVTYYGIGAIEASLGIYGIFGRLRATCWIVAVIALCGCLAMQSGLVEPSVNCGCGGKVVHLSWKYRQLVLLGLACLAFLSLSGCQSS